MVFAPPTSEPRATEAHVPGATGARRAVLAIARRALGVALATRPGLAAVNRAHRALTLDQKRRFFFLFFSPHYRTRGVWTVDVAGRRVRLPLGPEWPYGWTAATGFHGYDTEIHQVYEALLRSPRRPRVFFDVGANYGLHSLKFLAHGVRTVSFEPNPVCQPFFRRCAELNGFACDIRAVAITDAPGWAELVFPSGETYMGTIAPDVKAQWAERTDVTVLRVQCTTLDAVVDETGLVPDLVKIDTEGCDLAVLRGARHVLARRHPTLVFESWPASADRHALWGLLDDAGYAIQAVTYPFREGQVLSSADFLDARAGNFFAVARAGVGLGRRAGA